MNKHGFPIEGNYVPDHMLCGMPLPEWNADIATLTPVEFHEYKLLKLRKVKRDRINQKKPREYMPDLDLRIVYTDKAIQRTELALKYLMRG